MGSVHIPAERESARLDLPGIKIVPGPLRRRLQREAREILSREGHAPDYDAPMGDPGLFGPDSITWKIHADFPGMLAGGMAALMLQTLHPLALAGVWDYSTFRSNMLGRLRNTIAFVARTTYAPTAPAQAAVERVRVMHGRVRGVAPDGRPYSADDPHLLTWIHCAECWCLLAGYQTYCHRGLSVAVQDRYLAEMARIAEALGARDVPTSVSELTTFFAQVRGELVFDARVREVLAILQRMELPIPMAHLARDVFLASGAALLPPWALDLLHRPPLVRARDRVAVLALKAVAPSIRDAMAVGGLAWRACRRTDTDYADLFRWP